MLTKTNTNTFRSQADAQRAAREAIWGTVPLSQREFMPLDPGTLAINVVADVNGRLVLLRFDNYGRVAEKVVLP